MRVVKENIRYLVGWGGSPQDTWREYDELEGALAACRELAESDEELSDEERESLDVWGESHETGWGVCPEGDDGAYGACVVAQDYAGGQWHDWPAYPEEPIEIVDGPLYRVVTYLGNPAEEEHGTDLTLDEARELCEELAEDIAQDRAEDDEEPEEVGLYGEEHGGCCPSGDDGSRWPIYEEMI